MPDYFVVYCDGGARGNPGPAGIGVAIYKNDVCIQDIADYIGQATNNQAEYRAVIAALEAIEKLGGKGSTIDFVMDSELIVEQLNGRYKVKNAELKPLYARVQELIHSLGADVSFRGVPRKENSYADRLVNRAIDRTTANRKRRPEIS